MDNLKDHWYLKTIFLENIAKTNTYRSTKKTHVKVWKMKSKGNKSLKPIAFQRK